MIHTLKDYKNNRRALLLKILEEVRHFKLKGESQNNRFAQQQTHLKKDNLI